MQFMFGDKQKLRSRSKRQQKIFDTTACISVGIRAWYAESGNPECATSKPRRDTKCRRLSRICSHANRHYAMNLPSITTDNKITDHVLSLTAKDYYSNIRAPSNTQSVTPKLNQPLETEFQQGHS